MRCWRNTFTWIWCTCLRLPEVRFGDGPPQIVGEVTDEEFIDEVDGPEDIVDDQQEQGVVVVPADHEGIDAQDAVEDA